MINTDKMEKTFIQLSRAWYGKTCLDTYGDTSDEVSIILETEDRLLEFSIRWLDIGAHGRYPRLQIYDDAWIVFRLLPDLFDELSQLQDKSPSPEQICGLLEELHFEDATKEEKE